MSIILLIVILADRFLDVKVLDYFIAVILIIMVALMIHLVRSLRNEIMLQKQRNVKIQKEEFTRIKEDIELFKEKDTGPLNAGEKLGYIHKQISELLDHQKKHDYSASKGFDSFYKQLESLISIESVIGPLHFPLPGFRGWSISPDSMVIIISYILERKPAFVLEFGSGSSSIIIGYCLEINQKGKLLSVDHSQDYALKTSNMVKNHKLENRVEVVYAPLKVYNFDGKDYLWYSSDFTNGMDKIDMMMVDGPPGNLQKNSRYPAMKLMSGHLSGSGIVFLDDGYRNDEKEIVNMWLEENHELASEYVEVEKGLYIIQRA